MGRIGDDLRLKAVLEKARRRPGLPSVSGIPKEVALALIESCRQGTAPVQGSLLLAVGRGDLIDSIRRDLIDVASRGSCLRVINGVYGMGKTLTLRVLQEYAHREKFATSFLTLSSRECAMDDLSSIYRHIVKGIRVAECVDRPALEQILGVWAEKVKADVSRQKVIPWALTELGEHFQGALTQYYEGVRLARSEKADLALRWLRGEATMTDAKRLGINSIISSQNALVMLGKLTRMLRFVGTKGLVILLDEADAIPSLPSVARRDAAYTNLRSLACATSSTPYSYFVYATTPAFFDGIPPEFDEALKSVINLKQLKVKELTELAQEIRDLHFRAYDWRRGDLSGPFLRQFIHRCSSNSTESPRDFVRTLVAALDTCEENKGLTLDKVARVLS